MNRNGTQIAIHFDMILLPIDRYASLIYVRFDCSDETWMWKI